MKQQAFHRLVEDLTDKLFRFAVRLLNDEAAAKDAVQDTFIKIWDKRFELKKIKNHEAFAYTILKNRCYDELKSARIKLNNNNLNEEIITTKFEFDKQEELRLVNDLIEQLPTQQKAIIQLREIDGKEFEEIAEILDIEAINVRVILSRVRKKLKQQLTEIYAYGTQKNE